MTEPGLKARNLYLSEGETDMRGVYWGRGSIRQYFEQYTQFEGKSVLDFGCGRGNFVSFKPHGSYTGMEISEETANYNKFHFPQYKWVCYDGYNYMYNPNGKERVPPLKNHYDVCVAFSVFTHFTYEEAKDIIDVLKSHCDQVLFTYYSTRDRDAYDMICKWRNIEPNMWDDISKHDVFYLKTEKPEQWLWTFYDDDWLAERFKGEWHHTKFSKKSLRGFQRCLII